MTPNESKFYRGHQLHRTPSAIKDLETAFIRDSYITHEQVEDIAGRISADVESLVKHVRNQGEQITLILDLLKPKELLSRAKWGEGSTESYYVTEPKNDTDPYVFSWHEGDTAHSVSLYLADIEEFVAPIRTRILEHLQGRGVDIYFIKQALGKTSQKINQGNISLLNTGEVLKENKHQRLFCENTSVSIDPRHHRDALKELYHSKERSPYILYSLVTIDSKGYDTIMQYVDFSTLREFILDNPRLEPAVHYSLDVLYGVQFLIAHDLRLSDLRPANIALHADPATGAVTAKLFDLDTLYARNIPTYYATSADFFPPERLSPLRTDALELSPSPITEAEMVHDLGQTLWLIVRFVKMNDESESPKMRFCSLLEQLSERMKSTLPADRPTIEQVIIDTERLLETLG